ncbi:MAG: alpha/beta hydrolase [Silanimonas sp.]
MRRAALVLSCLMVALGVASFRPAAANGPIQSRIYPAPTAALDPAALPAGAAIVEVTTADGLTLRGVYAEPAEGRPVVLALPGNASSAADAFAWTSSLRARGFGVMAVGYRGYSGNPGTPSQAGLSADADAFLALLRQRHPDQPLWIIGHSLGGAVALDLAVRSPPSALVTWGTFTRLREMAPTLGRALVPDDWRNIDRARDLEAPWLLVHGMTDDVVPASQGEALHVAAGAAKRRGASFVGIGLGHAVDPALLDEVVAAGEHLLHTDAFDATGLPASLKLIPFGTSKPLNP